MKKNTFEDTINFMRHNQDKRKNSLSQDIDIYDNFKKMYFFDNEKLYELIHETDAWKLYTDFEDIEYIIIRMKKCIVDFKEKAGRFLEEKKFLEKKRTEYEEDFIEISYLFTSYTYTIFQIRKVLVEKYSVSHYNNKVKEIFSVDVVGTLIKAIRHTSVHRTLYKPQWQIEYKFPGKEINIMIDKKFLLKGTNLNNKNTINETYGKEINIIQLFEQYMQKVELLHEWHKKEIYQVYPEIVKERQKYADWLAALNTRVTRSLKIK